MFSLHETTQRLLCRGAFFALCIVPTALVLAYGVRLHQPSYLAAVASELARQMGVDVSLDDLVHPRPGETRLTNVRLFDPETGGEIGRMRELEIVEAEGRIVAFAAQPQIDARYFALVWRRLEDVLQGASTTARHVELRTADLTIAAPGVEAQTLQQVQLVVTREPTGAAAELRYTVSGVAMAEPAVLRIERRPTGEAEFSQQLTWRTGGAALPAAPWCAKFPWLARLGINCRFRGELTAEQTPSGWCGELEGELTHVDLETLVSDQFPHKLSGEARAIVEQLRFDCGRVTAARGRIEAGPGVIGQALVASAREHLALKLEGPAATEHKPEALRRYEQLALHFSLDDGQLTLRGECSAAEQGVALLLGGERYRVLPEHSTSPLALVRTLSPASDHQVPATEATRWLIQALPLPKEERQRNDSPPRGHVRGP